MTTTQKTGGAATVPAEGIPRVTPDTIDPIEHEIQAKGLTAPRITPADIEANIASEFYFTAGDGVRGESELGTAPAGRAKVLDLLTFCTLVLKNGFTVTGESACASPENFDPELGKKIARQNAVQKIWPLMGYALRSELSLIRAAGPASGEISNYPGTKTYVGTKVVHATPMRRGPYNALRGWTLPANENGNDEGYLVEYADGGPVTVEGFTGYISWSPKDVFERAYTTGCVVSPQVTKDFIDRMEDEFNDVTDKLGKLNVFRAGEVFPTLPYEDRRDMTDQAQAMDDYAWALRRRLRRAQEQKAKAAEQTAK